MKKFAYIALAFVLGVITSCTDKEEVEITRHHTLSYVVNTQSLYDELGITSEVVTNYLSKNYNVGVYTFVYDSDDNLVEKISFKESSLGTVPKTFKYKEGMYTIVTYETLVGNGYTPSWSGEEKLSTLVFEDNSSKDYHYTLGAVETKVALTGGDKTETVSPIATRHLLTLNINLQSMYDDFGITDQLTDKYLRGKDAPVGLFVYIYNSQGDMVDQFTTQQYSLNNVSLTRSLAKGDYTILSIETLVEPSNNLPLFWKFDDTMNLTSIKMKQIYSNPSKYNVIGTATTNTSLMGNKEISVTNKAIGSIVNFFAFNFENTSYAQIAFGTTDILDYYSFNPQLSRDDKFTEELSDPNFFTTRGTEMTPEESFTHYTSIYFLESKINWDFAVQYDPNGKWDFWKEGKANLEDGKNYYAGFYYLYNDDQTSHFSTYFGDVEDFISWKTKWDEYVENLNSTTLFEQPYTTWGGTVNAVKSYMSGYNIGNNGNLIENDGNYVLWYYGKNKEKEIDYYFTSSTGGLTDALVFFDSEEIGEDDLSKAFTEMGYTFVVSGDNYDAYITKDMKSYVMVFLNNQNYWVVRYFSASSSSSAPRRTMKKDFSTFAPKKQHCAISSKNIGKTSVVNSLRQCENTMKLYFK